MKSEQLPHTGVSKSAGIKRFSPLMRNPARSFRRLILTHNCAPMDNSGIEINSH